MKPVAIAFVTGRQAVAVLGSRILLPRCHEDIMKMDLGQCFLPNLYDP